MAGGHIAHLGGALVGILYGLFLKGKLSFSLPKRARQAPTSPILIARPGNESIPFWTKSAKVAMTSLTNEEKDTSS